MVIYRSESSRSRTSIQGGLRRGAAAAAVGAVLVLTAGAPASRAADGSTDPTEAARLAAGGDLSGAPALLKGLLGDPGGDDGTASPEPSPTTAGTATPAASPAPVSAAPVPAAQNAEPAPAPSAAATPPNPVPVSGTEGAGGPPGPAAPVAPQEAGGEAAPGTAGEAGGTTGNQPAPHGSGAPPASGPKRTESPSASRQNAALAAEEAPGAATAEVLLGVGLLGSAGAAGLVYARIRRF